MFSCTTPSIPPYTGVGSSQQSTHGPYDAPINFHSLARHRKSLSRPSRTLFDKSLVSTSKQLPRWPFIRYPGPLATLAHPPRAANLLEIEPIQCPIAPNTTYAYCQSLVVLILLSLHSLFCSHQQWTSPTLALIGTTPISRPSTLTAFVV